MRVVFVQDNGLNESLPLAELGGLLGASGHQVSVVIEREERDLRAAVAREAPDLLFIPAAILAHNWVLRTCKRLGGWFPDMPTVLAGSHPTLHPDIIERDGVRMIIVGEVEGATLDLLDALAGKRTLDDIENLHLKRGDRIIRNGLRPLVADLDALPMPDRGMYFDRYPFLGRFPWKKFTSGRGCFNQCGFCYQPIYREMCKGRGTYVRRKSPERIVAEVRQVVERYPTTNVHFSDDLFITKPSWMRAFAELYPREVGIPYTVNSSAEFVTEEMAELLGRSGCRAVAVGVEIYDERLRHSILKKRVTNDQIRNAARWIKARGIKLVTFNMVASPGETVEDSLDTLRFNAELGVDFARVTVCFPIPGSAMASETEANGTSLVKNDIYALPDLTEATFDHVFFTTAKPDEHRFVNLAQLFNLGVTRPRLIPLVARAIDLPANRLFGLLATGRMLDEKALFELSFLEGLRYFRHTGPPQKRTANFVSLV